jgi:hypothetical protein
MLHSVLEPVQQKKSKSGTIIVSGKKLYLDIMDILWVASG